MSNLYYVSEYKNKIISLLLENKNFTTLINPASDDGAIFDTHVFDYDFTNDNISDRKTFVFVETDIDAIRHNLFADCNLYVYVFTFKELVRLTESTAPNVSQVKNMGYYADTYANRIDVLCNIVDEIVNRNDSIKGITSIEPSGEEFCTLYSPNNNYYGKCLKYRISRLSDTE